MSRHSVHFLPAGKTVSADGGTIISDAAKEAGVKIELPCGGKGKCGRCMVSVSSEKDGQQSRVLACQAKISGDVYVRQSGSSGSF